MGPSSDVADDGSSSGDEIRHVSETSGSQRPAVFPHERAPDLARTDLDGNEIVLYEWFPDRSVVLVFVLRIDSEAAARITDIRRALGPETPVLAIVLDHDEASVDVDGVPVVIDDGGAVVDYLGPHPPASGAAVIIDRSRRVVALTPLAHESAITVVTRAAARVPANGQVPALIVPDVIEPDLCRSLISFHTSSETILSPMLRADADGGDELRPDPTAKIRRDVVLDDDLSRAVVLRIQRRLLPEVERAFGHRPDSYEPFKLACYRAIEGGWFVAHRDNSTADVAHRRLAITLELDTSAYEGGRVQFPEFMAPWPVAPSGGALVFSCSFVHQVTPVIRGDRYVLISFLT